MITSKEARMKGSVMTAKLRLKEEEIGEIMRRVSSRCSEGGEDYSFFLVAEEIQTVLLARAEKEKAEAVEDAIENTRIGYHVEVIPQVIEKAKKEEKGRVMNLIEKECLVTREEGNIQEDEETVIECANMVWWQALKES